MAGLINKAPFRWVHALLAMIAGVILVSVILAVATVQGGLMPIISYVVIVAFGGGFALLLYLGRNTPASGRTWGIYDREVGNMADFGSGNGTSSWGRMGQDVTTSEENLAASRRNDL